MEIVDISQPDNPGHESSFWHATSCDPVYPVGDIAYVTLRTGDTGSPGDFNALVVLDISTSMFMHTELQEIERISPFGMTLIGDRLYVEKEKMVLKFLMQQIEEISP